MKTPPLLVLDGWLALTKSNPGSCKLLSLHEISELRKILERHNYHCQCTNRRHIFETLANIYNEEFCENSF